MTELGKRMQWDRIKNLFHDRPYGSASFNEPSFIAGVLCAYEALGRLDESPLHWPLLLMQGKSIFDKEEEEF